MSDWFSRVRRSLSGIGGCAAWFVIPALLGMGLGMAIDARDARYAERAKVTAEARDENCRALCASRGCDSVRWHRIRGGFGVNYLCTCEDGSQGYIP